MNYYKEDRSPERWAAFALLLYLAALAAAGWLVSVDASTPREGTEMILVDFVEPEPKPEPPARPKPKPAAQEAPAHEKPAPEEQTAQNAGEEEETRTVNPKAIFNMSKVGEEHPAAGNPHAPKGDEEKEHGDGPGVKPDGFDQLDRGLQGRGLRGDLPKPAYPGNRSGKIVIRVTVDGAGNVVSAAYEPKGSTSSDAELIAAASAAARKAKFIESQAAVQGGTITYVFRLE